jgi:hypothetical protein
MAELLSQFAWVMMFAVAGGIAFACSFVLIMIFVFLCIMVIPFVPR